MSLPATMRALRQTSFNGPQNLRLVTDAPVPTPGPGEILIRVTAAGLNIADLSQARGGFAGGPQPPYIAGCEGAGEIVALGDGVTNLATGMHVIGFGTGAFAQYMLLPAIAAVPIPQGFADEQALGMVVNWPAAIAALKPLGRLAAGETVLIHAAAGATGQAAVKIAKHYGATVIATASAWKHDTVRALGADHILDAQGENLAQQVRDLTGGNGADLVIESVGGAMFEQSLAATRRVTGRIVVTGLPAGAASLSNWDLVYKHQVQVIGLNVGALIRFAPQVFGAVIGELFALVGAGILPVAPPTMVDLADGPKALADLESRATTGKLGLRP
jgi:NADPH2:quinone reductase